MQQNIDHISKKPAVILLAEDSPSDRTIVRRALERGKITCTLKEVEDGEALLNYLYNTPPYTDTMQNPLPDLILLDINMPRCDGKSALKKIRGDGRLNAIPIVILTTSDRDEDVLETYNLHVNAYIKKPVEHEAFMNTVLQLEKFWFELVTLPSKVKFNP